jgi:hypothetical protein
MNIDPITRLKRIAALEVAQARLLARRQPGSVRVLLLRDQPLVCDCCGRLLSAGDEVTMPRGLAVGARADWRRGDHGLAT